MVQLSLTPSRLQQGEKVMRSLLNPTLLMNLRQNPAGLLVDLGILAVFVVALVIR
jgi:hypothetical protein